MEFLHSKAKLYLCTILREYISEQHERVSGALEEGLKLTEKHDKMDHHMELAQRARDLLKGVMEGGFKKHFLYQLLDPTEDNRCIGRSEDMAKAYIDIANRNLKTWIKPVDHVMKGADSGKLMIDLIKKILGEGPNGVDDFEFKETEFMRTHFSAEIGIPKVEEYYG